MPVLRSNRLLVVWSIVGTVYTQFRFFSPHPSQKRQFQEQRKLPQQLKGCVANRIGLAGEAGLYGNAFHECGAVRGDGNWDPKQKQDNYRKGQPNRAGRGPFQLDHPLKEIFKAGRRTLRRPGGQIEEGWNANDWSLTNQFKFVFHRHNGLGEVNHDVMMHELRDSVNPRAAAEIFMKRFENPEEGNPHLDERQNAAERYFNANGYR